MGDLGRPTELNDITAQLVTNALKKGLSRKGIASAAGIGETTLYRWLDASASPGEDFRRFRERFAKAEAELEERLVEALEKLAIGGDRHALIFLLERRIRGPWLPPPKDATPEPDKYERMTPEELREEYECMTGRKWGA